MSEPKFPDVNVDLVGEDGHAFAIIVRAAAAIRHKHGAEAAATYEKKAMACDYDHVLQVTMKTVETATYDGEGTS